MSTKKKLKKNQKKKLLRLFLTGMGVTFIVCAVVVGVVIGTYNKYIMDGSGSGSIFGTNGSGDKDVQEVDENGVPIEVVNKNLAVFGVDKDGYRTDVSFVVNFNSETDKVKVVGIPRDTKVTWSDEQKAKARELGRPMAYVSKLNEMTSYGGIENIREFTVNQLERMLNIKIDNYIVVDIEAFRKIVDAIGGVDLYVPQNMYHVDRAGDLYINLKEGYQHLDGAQSEQFVRFRGYLRGDEDRIVAQQAFLKAFAEKVMSPSIITKVPKIISVVFDSIQTDISLFEIGKYYPYLNNFDMNNLSFYTVPGEGRYEGGVSYFFIDNNQMNDFLQEVFFEKPKVEGEEETEPVEDKTVSIEVLNGSGKAGAASAEKATLEAAGYTISTIGNYTRSDLTQTLIFAKDTKKAEQFKTYYPNAAISQTTSIGTDIQIVLGKDE